MAKTAKQKYKSAYNKGYNAGLRKSKQSEIKIATKPKEDFRKAYPQADKISKGFNADYTKAFEQPATDTRVFKWEGFTEAMNLIIASKRG